MKFLKSHCIQNYHITVSRIQYWTSKINNIVKEIRNIKSTFRNRKNNQNNPDKYVEGGKGNKYSSHNNLEYHDQTSNHDIPEHHGQPPTHNDPDTYPIDQPLHPNHSYPDIDESGIEPTSSYEFPSSKACTADTVRKPASSPSDPSSLMNGSHDPSEEGVMGSSGESRRGKGGLGKIYPQLSRHSESRGGVDVHGGG